MLSAALELAVIVAVMALGVALHRALSSRPPGVRGRSPYATLADEMGLRYVEEPDRGPTLRGHRAGVDLAIFRTQLRIGHWFHCATAVASRALPSMVVHHRAFPFPSTAARGVARNDTGDEAFEKKYELHGRGALPLEVRTALLALPCAELTVLSQRVTVVWPAKGPPSAEEIDAARTAVEALAREDEGAAYR